MKFLLALAALGTFAQAFTIETLAVLKEQNGTARDCIIKQCDPQIKTCMANDDCKKVVLGAQETCNNKTGDDQDRCQIRQIATSRNKMAEEILRCGHAHQCYQPRMGRPERPAFFGPVQCMREHCSEQMKNCSREVDPKCSQAFRNCERKCQSDANPRNCMNTCVNESRETNAVALNKCGNDNHCFDKVQDKFEIPHPFNLKDPEQCRKEHCPNETAACAADPKCAAAIKACSDKCSKNPFCWDSCMKSCGDGPAKDEYNCCKKYHCY